jgi:hypothetical protein
MNWTESPAYRIAEWLKAEFPARHVELDDHVDTESVLFYIDAPLAPVLQIGERVLEQYSVREIVDFLVGEHVLERLRWDPTIRLSLDASGTVPPVESRTIECDGRTYRVQRDTEHNVRIFDANGRLLENTPRTMLVMPDSIHQRNISAWQEDIRQWRGRDQ